MKGHHHHGRKNDYTHFASLPFIRNTHRQSISTTQDIIQSLLVKCMEPKKIRRASNLLMHLTLGMLSLSDNLIQAKAVSILDQLRQECEKELKHTSLTLSKIGYFSRYSNRSKCNEVTVIYLQPEQDKQLDKVKKIFDRILRRMVEEDIVNEKDFGSMHVKYNKTINRFEINEYHLTLFRLEGGVLEDGLFLQTIQDLKQIVKPLRMECDFVDISTRFHYDQTKFYAPLTRIKLESEM